MSRFGTVIGSTFVGGGGGGGTVDAIARADIAAITGVSGDTIADGETTWIAGQGPFINNTGGPLTVPAPATRANMLALGFTEVSDDQLPEPRVITANDTIAQGEHVVGSANAQITATVASGVTYFWVSRALDMAFDVIVISADAPTVTVAGDATGANLNEPSGPVLFIQDPTDTNNFLAVTNGVAYGATGGGTGIVQSEGAGLDIDGAGTISLNISDLPSAV